MAEEEKRQKAAFRKKVTWPQKPEHLSWNPFDSTSTLTRTLSTCLFRWRKRCPILFRIVHNRNESTSPWGRSKGVSCKLLVLSKISYFICVYKQYTYNQPVMSISIKQKLDRCVWSIVFHLFRHDVAEVAGLTSFSFGEDEESRYVMLFKKVWKLLSWLLP